MVTPVLPKALEEAMKLMQPLAFPINEIKFRKAYSKLIWSFKTILSRHFVFYWNWKSCELTKKFCEPPKITSHCHNTQLKVIFQQISDRKFFLAQYLSTFSTASKSYTTSAKKARDRSICLSRSYPRSINSTNPAPAGYW